MSDKLFVDNERKWDWKKIGYRFRSAFAVTLSLVILIGGGLFAYNKAYTAYIEWRSAEDFLGEGKEKINVTIPGGSSGVQIGEILIDANVVKTMKAYRNAVMAHPRGNKIPAGTFALKTELPAKKAVEMLLDPKNRVFKRITIIEGLRLERQWKSLSKATGISVKDFKAGVAETPKYGLPKWAGGKAEGFMFPDTYEVQGSPTVEEIFTKQIQQFNKVSNSLKFEDRAEKLKIKPLNMLTVASLIQAEVATEEYMPKVARVIYNRLEKGMPLQFDSTVHYAVNKYDTALTSEEQRKVDSPYNTYLDKNAGKLPPGPINSPGKAAMRAAMEPAEGNELYFVTVNLDTGETLFADSFEKHKINVQKLNEFCKKSDKC